MPSEQPIYTDTYQAMLRRGSSGLPLQAGEVADYGSRPFLDAIKPALIAFGFGVLCAVVVIAAAANSGVQ